MPAGGRRAPWPRTRPRRPASPADRARRLDQLVGRDGRHRLVLRPGRAPSRCASAPARAEAPEHRGAGQRGERAERAQPEPGEQVGEVGAAAVRGVDRSASTVTGHGARNAGDLPRRDHQRVGARSSRPRAARPAANAPSAIPTRTSAMPSSRTRATIRAAQARRRRRSSATARASGTTAGPARSSTKRGVSSLHRARRRPRTRARLGVSSASSTTRPAQRASASRRRRPDGHLLGTRLARRRAAPPSRARAAARRPPPARRAARDRGGGRATTGQSGHQSAQVRGGLPHDVTTDQPARASSPARGRAAAPRPSTCTRSRRPASSPARSVQTVPRRAGRVQHVRRAHRATPRHGLGDHQHRLALARRAPPAGGRRPAARRAGTSATTRLTPSSSAATTVAQRAGGTRRTTANRSSATPASAAARRRRGCASSSTAAAHSPSRGDRRRELEGDRGRARARVPVDPQHRPRATLPPGTSSAERARQRDRPARRASTSGLAPGAPRSPSVRPGFVVTPGKRSSGKPRDLDSTEHMFDPAIAARRTGRFRRGRLRVGSGGAWSSGSTPSGPSESGDQPASSP